VDAVVVCETSADCGALKCIEGVCRDPNGPAPVIPRRPPGDYAWFGSETGYGLLVAALDAAAAAVEPFLLLAAGQNSGPPQTALGIMCFVPVSITGSTVHFAHGRAVPGIISFFGWASHAGTTFLLGGLVGLLTERGFEFNNETAWATGLAFGAAGGVALAALDVWMARPVASFDVRKHAPKKNFAIAPITSPTRGGAFFGVAASF
jgi:hypothetical protein